MLTTSSAISPAGAPSRARLRRDLPGERAVGVVEPDHRGDLLGCGLLATSGPDGRQLHGRLLDVVQRVEVEGQDGGRSIRALRLLVEPGPRLGTEAAFLHEPGHGIREGEPLSPRIVRAPGLDRAEDVRHRVEPDDVGGAEYGRLGPTHHRPEDLVRLRDADAELGHPVEDRCHAERTDPVGDEVRGVLGVYHALSEHRLTELGHGGEDPGIGVGARHDLQEPHVADRVEEVGDHEVTPEVVAPPFGHGRHGQPGGVRRDDAARPTVLLDHLEHAA